MTDETTARFLDILTASRTTAEQGVGTIRQFFDDWEECDWMEWGVNFPPRGGDISDGTFAGITAGIFDGIPGWSVIDWENGDIRAAAGTSVTTQDLANIARVFLHAALASHLIDREEE